MFKKLTSLVLCLLLCLESFTGVVYASSEETSEEAKNKYSFESLINSPDNVSENEITINSREIKLLYDGAKIAEKYVIKKVVDKKYIGCGNLIDWSEDKINGFDGFLLATYDVLYDTIGNFAFTESLVNLKTAPHVKTYLEHSKYDEKNYNYASNEYNYDTSDCVINDKQSVDYLVNNQIRRYFLLENNAFNSLGELEAAKLVENHIGEVTDKENSFSIIQEIVKVDSVAEYKYVKKKHIKSTIDKRIARYDNLYFNNQKEEFKKVFADKNADELENTRLITNEIEINREIQHLDVNKLDANLNLDEKTKIVGRQIEDIDNLNNTRNIKGEVIEEINISAGIAGPKESYGWNRAGIRVRKAEGKEAITDMLDLSCDDYVNKGGKLVVDKGNFVDVAVSYVSLPDKKEIKNEREHIEKQDWSITEQKVREYDDICYVNAILRNSEQSFEYDYLKEKITLDVPIVNEVETNVKSTNQVKETTTFHKFLQQDLSEYLGSNVVSEYVPVVETKTITRKKKGNRDNILVSKWVVGNQTFDKLVIAFTELKDYKFFGKQMDYYNYIEDKDFATSKEDTKVKHDTGDKVVNKEYVKGSSADWWFVGGIANLASKSTLGADVEVLDVVDAALDAVDIAFLVTTGVSVASAGKKLAQKISKVGMKKYVKSITKVGAKKLLSKAMMSRTAMAKNAKTIGKYAVKEGKETAIDMGAGFILEKTGHPELAKAVVLRRTAMSKFSSLKAGMIGRKRLPSSANGSWSGKPGNSYYKPHMNKKPKLNNPSNLTYGEIFKQLGIEKGIRYKNGYPVISSLGKDKFSIKYFTSNRTVNFNQFKEQMAKKLNKQGFMGRTNWKASEIEEHYLKKNGLTLHEMENTRQIVAIPSILHNNLPHSGGIEVMKRTPNFFRNQINLLQYKTERFMNNTATSWGYSF